MKKMMILILISIGVSLIFAQYPGTPNIKPPIPADIDDALITWAIINAATKEQKECKLYIDKYHISTTFGEIDGHNYIFETVIDTYTGTIISREKKLAAHY